jgi:hypothetical protein
MQGVMTKQELLEELDKAIVQAGSTVYFNHLFGTCDPADPTYVLSLERARHMLSGVMTTQEAMNYAKDLLTIKRNG